MGCTQSKSATAMVESSGKGVPSAKASPSTTNPANESADLTATRTASSEDIDAAGSKDTPETQEEHPSAAESASDKNLASGTSPETQNPTEEVALDDTSDKITKGEPKEETESEVSTKVQESAKPTDTKPEEEAAVKALPGKKETQPSVSERSINEATPMKKDSSTEEKACAGCNIPETEAGGFKFCARCKLVSYCGRDCQIKHWKEHKKFCSSLASEDSNSELMAEWGLSPNSCSNRAEKLNESTNNSVHEDAVRELEAELLRLRSEDPELQEDSDAGAEPTKATNVTGSDPIEDAREAVDVQAADENTAPAAAQNVTEIKEIAAPKIHKCAGCSKEEKAAGAFKSCAKCREVYYCGRACQKGHWKQHKKICCKSDSRKSSLANQDPSLNLYQG